MLLRNTAAQRGTRGAQPGGHQVPGPSRHRGHRPRRRHWRPPRGELALSNAVEWLWWVGAAAALASVVVLAGAVYPRLDRREVYGAAMYYADIVHLDSPATVTSALMRSSESDLERVADQLYRVSHIVGRKYRLIRWGFWLLLGGMAATVSAALINVVLTGSSP
ncbi:Pycsar system effector family protein [Nonomuraea sp. NPDC049709]|uniref:Pycsar system effector family protein n=1 Tax=Nonomuraea sp. NPDC049709 TaxID=3154736 RepID=UPI00341C57C6